MSQDKSGLTLPGAKRVDPKITDLKRVLQPSRLIINAISLQHIC
jgi:hypothetical protein